MPMGLYRFRFDSRPDETISPPDAKRARPQAAGRVRAVPAGVETIFRELLSREIGPWRARWVDLEWSDDAAGGGVLGVLSQNGVTLAYAAKVAAAMGGVRVPLVDGTELRALPMWTATAWIELPWLVRAKIWIGRQ